MSGHKTESQGAHVSLKQSIHELMSWSTIQLIRETINWVKHVWGNLHFGCGKLGRNQNERWDYVHQAALEQLTICVIGVSGYLIVIVKAAGNL